MKRSVKYGLIFLTLLNPVSMDLFGASNPHPMEPCAWSGCHAVEPIGGEVLLHEDSIDNTCCICHSGKCSLTEGNNHASNINRWDTREFRRPRSLPLYNGYITCLTCHFRIKPDGADYKMVRIVTIRENGVAWEELCRDCHAHH